MTKKPILNCLNKIPPSIVFGFIIFSLVLTPVLGCAAQDKGLSLKQAFDELSQVYKIQVIHKYTPDVFHEAWRKPPIQAIGTEPSDSEKKIFLESLKVALAAYPKEVLQEHLLGIVILKKLLLYNTLYGGTYAYFDEPGWNVIYLSRGLISDTDLPEFLIDSFHHEFSSILMRSHHFPETEWKKVNETSFKYAYEESVKALQDHVQNSSDENLFPQGFLSQYAMSNLEEDFNVFSGVALTYPEWMIELVQKHERLKQKLLIWLGFYLSIDRGFSQTKAFKLYKEKNLWP